MALGHSMPGRQGREWVPGSSLEWNSETNKYDRNTR